MEFPAFAPRFPWRGGDLQTLRNFLLRAAADLSSWPGERLALAMGDGSGDRLAGSFHRPQSSGDKPLALLVHGLTGCEDSSYIRATARHLLRSGWPVLRLNLRGAGPSRPLCRGHYHAGRSQDLADAVIAFERQKPQALRQGLVWVGFSLGANMLLKHLAETTGSQSLVRAAVAVSTPLDLAEASAAMAQSRNRVYHRYLLERMKDEALAGAAEVTAAARQQIIQAKTIFDFDNGFIAPLAGFADAEAYYRQSSSQVFLAAIGIPTLAIQALDDPWIPSAAYERFDWSGNRWLTPLLSETGGHVGFHGKGSAVAWHNRCLEQYLTEVCV